MMLPLRHLPQKAFTLIELSIVLVIIGLIVGGILVGRDLIHASELRSLISSVNHHKTVINTFKLKYNAIPGDMRNASTFFTDMPGTCSSSCNGNGDKRITENESSRFYVHASKAGLMSGNFTGAIIGYAQPGSEFGVVPGCKNCVFRPVYHNAISVYFLRSGNAIALRDISAAVNGGYTGGLLPIDALAVDTKMDDGEPFGGQVHAYNYAACVNSSGYRITINIPYCAMGFYWD